MYIRYAAILKLCRHLIICIKLYLKYIETYCLPSPPPHEAGKTPPKINAFEGVNFKKEASELIVEFSDVFRVYRNRPVVWKGLIKNVSSVY